MQTLKQTLGRRGEGVAAEYLKGRGHTILARNFKKPWGELDIVSKRRNVIHFVEVKSGGQRSSAAFAPEYNLAPRQRRRLAAAARLYLAQNKYPPYQEYQIDVMAVDLTRNQEPVIRYYERAIVYES